MTPTPTSHFTPLGPICVTPHAPPSGPLEIVAHDEAARDFLRKDNALTAVLRYALLPTLLAWAALASLALWGFPF